MDSRGIDLDGKGQSILICQLHFTIQGNILLLKPNEIWEIFYLDLVLINESAVLSMKAFY